MNDVPEKGISGIAVAVGVGVVVGALALAAIDHVVLKGHYRRRVGEFIRSCGGAPAEDPAPLTGDLAVSVFLVEDLTGEAQHGLPDVVVVVAARMGNDVQQTQTLESGVAVFELPQGDYDVTLQLNTVPANVQPLTQPSMPIHIEANGHEEVQFAFAQTLARVHFIWYGSGKPSKANTRTPNELAEMLGSNVTYWCLNEMVPDFRGVLRDNVTVEPIEDFLERIADADRRQRIDEILDFYKNNKGYAPAKDLIMFLVLQYEGGYYFDANCVFERAVLLEELRSNRMCPAFLNMGDSFFLLKAVSEQDYDELTFPLASDEFETSNVRQTDMWAMYAPPGGSDVFELIVGQYIDRATRFGLFQACNLTEQVERDGQETFLQGDSNAKRTIAGAVAIRSIQAGMNSLLGQQDYDLDNANWPTESNLGDAGDEYKVECLGLDKKHGGSW